MVKILFGVDPSYSRTGISMFCNGKIYVSEVKGKEVLGRDTFAKSFEGIFIESDIISRAIVKEMRRMESLAIGNSLELVERSIISECPPPQGNYAPGLYALDIRLFSLYEEMTTNVFRVYPNYLMHLHGKRKYDKSESVALATEIMNYYEREVLTKRLSHDESESVIFLARLMHINGLLPIELIKVIPNIKNEKEAMFEYLSI